MKLTSKHPVNCPCPACTKSQQILLQKDYSWEELSDLERDVYEAVEFSEDIPGEYEGVIRVTMEYIKDE